MPTYNPNDFYPASDAEVKSDGNVTYRENTSGTLLPSGTRTATNNTPDQTNYNAKGVLVSLNISSASGTGGIQVSIKGRDPVTNSSFSLNATPTAVTAQGNFTYLLYPGASGGLITQTTGLPLPKNWYVSVIHSDASSYTYSLGYQLIL